MKKYENYKFKNHTGLTKVMVFFLYAYTFFTILLVFSTIYEYSLLLNIKQGITISIETVNSQNARQALLARAWGISMLITMICFCFWLYRADNNALSLHPNETKNTPGWSVGWYFVPVVHLYAGYQSMNEIWKVSKNPVFWKEEITPTLIKWWWFFWILSNIIFTISSKIGSTKNIDAYMNLSLMNIFAFIGQGICAYLLILIIKKIYIFQAHSYQSLKTIAK